MPKRVKDALSQLKNEELANVLKELLKQHSELRKEANSIAEKMISSVSVEDVAESISYSLSSVDSEEVYLRSDDFR